MGNENPSLMFTHEGEEHNLSESHTTVLEVKMVRQVDYGLYRYNNMPLKLLGLQSRDHSGKDNEQLFLQQGAANTMNIVVHVDFNMRVVPRTDPKVAGKPRVLFEQNHASNRLLSSSLSNTETDPTEYKAEDEAIVNKALILSLETGSNLAGPLLVGWALKQFQFSPRFNKENYITFTDGDLWDAITRRIYAIIEVKKHQFRLNTAKGIKIPMQESAQSVGLLKRTEEDPRLFKNQSVIALY
ncbi:hypothetical protein BDV37DRAFT_285406 [Aspergillus pseudonomiae]|uniref:Uncharacterized protein n=1 Tax=Aspergillus pseudonomiae TaxID=1506151 RepID=A0A5N7D6E1_9EURO|nr:uncharacterized protein BDV37DRAFT_285406 [Aspergillus pseudonomiae]KAE8401707.1 hypothetical protein BDV37DRAFT_285406 [Aspergillus pseudonomiae]